MPLVGTFLQAASAASAELLAGAGLDFLCVEAEHSGLGRESVQSLVATASLGGTAALVRVAANAPVEIAAALDAGAAGVIVPRVDSAAEAAEAVAAARYPPLGSRGLGPGRATRYGATIGDYFARANAALLVGVQIESERAVAEAGAIASCPGVDFVFVGPGDLAVSLGAGFGGERVREAVAAVLADARAAGRPAGIWAPDAAGARDWLRAGFQMVIVGSDLGLLAGAVAGALAELAEVRG